MLKIEYQNIHKTNINNLKKLIIEFEQFALTLKTRTSPRRVCLSSGQWLQTGHSPPFPVNE